MKALIKRGNKLLAEAEIISLPYRRRKLPTPIPIFYSGARLEDYTSVSGQLRLTAGSSGDIATDLWDIEILSTCESDRLPWAKGTYPDCKTTKIQGDIVTFESVYTQVHHPEKSEHTLKT